MPEHQKRWEIMPPAPAEHPAKFPGLSPLVAQLLYNRQIRTADAADVFLSGTFDSHDPFLLKDMNEAVTRLRQAIRSGEPIAVYGDYDVDGVTATVLLVSVLGALGARVIPYIPHRVDEGYGLTNKALQDLADRGIKVVVTVDCGVRAVRQVAFARDLGMDTIITDHHAVSSDLPQAMAVIDPRREDDGYPFKHLAGVGLAFKLAQALLRVEHQVHLVQSRALPQEDDLIDLVALGTVADLAPLVGENRALVRSGLEKLNEARRPGIAAMMREAGLKPGEVDAGKIGFVIGPRLNAAGRMADAIASYSLLTTSSVEEAAELAIQLGQQNRERQQRMNEMVEHARSQIRALGDEPIYVLASRDYTAGIAGLVASRIKDEFYRPTLVIALEEEDGKSRGSARSISALNIAAALDECDELLLRYGGHAAAAGFSIRNDQIDPFRSRLNAIAARQLTSEDLIPSLRIDMALPLHQAHWETLALIETLEPFGAGNPRPTFCSYDAQVRDCRSVGSKGKTLKLTLSDGKAVWDAIAFRAGIEAEHVPPRIDIVYTLEASVWNNRRRLQLVVKDLRPAEGPEGSSTTRTDPL